MFQQRVLACLSIFALVLVLGGCEAAAHSSKSASSNLSSSSITQRSSDDDEKISAILCPVGLVSGKTLDEEFGPGTAEITRCLENGKIKVVYSLSKACTTEACTKAYGLINIDNAIKDYEITHGLVAGLDYTIVAVVYGNGHLLVVDNNAANPFAEPNPFQTQVQGLIDKGVQFYFCQNAARSNKVVTANLLPGIKYVTAGVTAIADFQESGYSYVSP